jgi:hypothetical protein
MASANWAGATELQARMPHTYTAMEHLIMAMADAYNNRGKTNFFGQDKGLKSYVKFEEKLKNLLLAMVLDGFIARTDTSKKYLAGLLLLLDAWQQLFPNWPDADAFALEKLRANEHEARKLISLLIGVR